MAMEILIEERRKGVIEGVEKKEFKPKYELERLSDYGEKPEEGFCKSLENVELFRIGAVLRR